MEICCADSKKVNQSNTIINEAGLDIKGSLVGDDNLIKVGASSKNESDENLIIQISGNNNKIIIEPNSTLVDLSIVIGSPESPANGVIVYIGPNFYCGSNCVLFLYDSNTSLKIGSDCMFSNNIVVRCGELPHLIFDLESGAYIGHSDGVYIGNQVWVGELSYINKRAFIPDGCIVGASAVVNGRFSQRNCIIGGNPARVVKEGVKWVRNKSYLEAGSKFAESWATFENSMTPAKESE